MTDCTRTGCGGTLGIFSYGTTCHQCARVRSQLERQPPTKSRGRGSGVVTEPNYFAGIYALDYVPTPEELSRGGLVARSHTQRRFDPHP